ncbi:MAG: hypothetical protein VZR06_07590 [Butyrivibrio sp.]|uniref:hypothetical protein n=1 Tax=Butyrivibrio sp. LB2008 TaxID=1408305 RepID=UPI00047E1AF3|nr:hypothetical protein [Butyrivibrio sp. LB2008]MEE3495005.1 hypothetical protein [Butyrivibrio sp.]
MQVNTFRLNKMMKKIAVVFITATIFVVLAGCGEEKQDVTSIKIDRRGKITNVIYEDFPEDEYSLDEFESITTSRVEAFNNESLAEKITIDTIEEEDSKIKVVMKYDSPSDYKKFNNTVLFYGTVKEAEEAGYTLTDKLVDREGNASDKDLLKKYKNKHVIIIEEKTDIIVPYKIDYISRGATFTSKREADLSGCRTQLVQLLLSK